MFKRVFALTLIVLMILSALAYGAETVYRIGLHEEPTTKNPIAIFGGSDGTIWNFAVTNYWFDSLAGSIAPRFDYAPSLATTIVDQSQMKEEKAGGSTYITAMVPLRRDIEWSDGTRLTARDVAFTYNAVLALDPAKLSGNWPGYIDGDVLEKAEAVDEFTVKFWLKQMPGLGEWQFGLLGAPILQKAQWEQHVNAALESEDPIQTIRAVDITPVVSGPYQFAKWEKGAFWENTRNPKDTTVHEKTILFENGSFAVTNPDTGYTYRSEGAGGDVELTLESGNADHVLFRIYQNQNAAVLALSKGEIDFWNSPGGLTKGFEAQLRKTADVDIIENPANGFNYMAYNFRRQPTDDLAFRKAVSTMIDRELLADTVLSGVVVPMHTYVPAANAYWHNPNVDHPGAGMTGPERVAAAVRILKQAGYTWREEPQVDLEGGSYTPGEGLIMPDGEPVPELTFIAPSAAYDPLRSTFALYIERWMKDLGIPVQSQLGLLNAIGEDIFDNQDFHLYILGWGLGNPAFPDYLTLFFHPDLAGPGGWNTGGYDNPEYVELSNRFEAAQSLEEARKVAFEMQEVLARDEVYTVLFTTTLDEAYRSDRVDFAYTRVLDGIQGSYGQQSGVTVIK